jgi:predicted dehydrogenase
MYAPYLKQTEPLKTECQHFIECIKENKVPKSSSLDGLKVVEVLEAASISLKQGGARVDIAELNKITGNTTGGNDVENIFENVN